MLSLWVRKELSYCLNMLGVELVDEDVVVGILGCRGRHRLSIDENHPLHHQHLSLLQSWNA